MVRLGLGICAVLFTLMLLIPVPMARIGTPVRLTSGATVTTRPDGRIGASANLQTWTSLPQDTRVEIPAPQAFVGLHEVSSFAATAPGPETAATLFQVIAPRAALRADPAPNARVIGRLKIGQRVEVLTRLERDWPYVRLLDSKTEGFVSMSDLEPAP